MEAALRWFDLTHEPVPAEGRWRRTALPSSGGAGDQDARLMEALEVLRHVHDDILRKTLKNT